MMSDDKPDSPATEGQAADAAPATEAADAAAENKSAWAQKGSEAELQALKEENAQLKDRLLRTMAEMENLRKRTERDKADTAKYAISQFARSVLTIGDNIRRAIDAVPRDAVENDAPLRALLEGVEVTERELINVLERHGIKRLEPKGERFDPHLHQAMLEVENKDVPAGMVQDVLQAGYVIGERVLRPALVSVTKGGPPLAAEAREEARRPANNNIPEPQQPQAPAEDEAGPEGDGNGTDGKGTDGTVGSRVDRSA